MACVLCTAMVAGSLTGCASAKSPAQESVAATDSESTDEDVLVNAMASASAAGAQMAQKQETVYVKTNASGGVDSVIVSDWLKNSGKSGTLLDSSDLKDIKNLKGKQGYTENDGQMAWDASGEDIYYQGTTDKALPVDVEISYKLNGNPVSPEELAGKSGHVEICLNYVNHETQKVEISGEEETIYTPFAVMSGMILDDEKFTNVAVTNGTVISDGNKDIVIGMAFPGLVDSLNGSAVTDRELLGQIEEEIKIPSEVTVSADTSDFELGMTMTMVSSDVMSALGLENVDTDSNRFDSLKESMTEFKNAGSELVKGTGQLRSGAGQLNDGALQLADGSGQLYDGVVKYTDGVGKVNDGAGQLNEGAGKLDSGVGALKDGIDQVDAGAGALSDGISQVDAGAGALSDGISRVDAGAGALSDGIDNASAGADQVKDGAAQVSAGAAGLKDGAAQVSAGIQGLQSQMSALGALKDGLGQAASGAAQIRDGLSALAANLSGASFQAVSEVSGVSAEQVGMPDASGVDSIGYVSVSTDGMSDEAAAAVNDAVS
ncbi:MAG: hypothetical protein IKS87_04335, partial [Lachnospiraceae bacterium]|nr:hypothetical protein [Lachnospiraceae bacterium]